MFSRCTILITTRAIASVGFVAGFAVGLPLDAIAQSSNPLRTIRQAVVATDTFHDSDANSARIISSNDIANERTLQNANGNGSDNQASGMPPEVYQAIYTNQTSQQPLLDNAVQPATHIAPVEARLLPTQTGQKTGNNLAVLGQALNSIQRETTKVESSDDAEQPTSVNNWNNHFATNATATADPELNERPVAQSPFAKTDTQSSVEAANQTDHAPLKSTSTDQPKMRKMIEHLAISTCFVLCGGVGFILVAKQFLKLKSPSPKTAEAPIQIKSKIQLSPKSSLFLVQAGQHRLMVASDQNGIKSVVPLNDSFTDTLNSFDATAETFAGEMRLDDSEVHDQAQLDLRHDEPSDNVPKPAAATKAAATRSLGQPNRNKPASDEPTRHKRNGNLPPELYSLATVGKRTAVQRPVSKSTESQSETSSDANVRRKMENALRDQGLKDLLMQSLQNK